MYLAMASLEVIISHTSLENQFRQLARERIDDLSELINFLAQKSVLLLERLASILQEERYYFYFDGQQFIPSPEFSLSTFQHFIERITHSDLFLRLPMYSIV